MAWDKEALDLLGAESESTLTPSVSEETAMGGAYEAAQRNQRTLALWSPPLQSADLDIVPEKAELDARARDTLRNDAYVRGGATIHQDNIVGSLYALNAKPMTKILGEGFDDTWEEEFQEEVETRFTLYAESPDCWIDASRSNTFTDLVRLAVGVHTAGGEALSTVEWLRSGGRPFSTAIKFVDTDRLCNPPTRFNDPRTVGGVQKNKFGAPIQYHIRTRHPSDYYLMRQPEWKAVPARKPWGRIQVIHIFEQMRPDQTRGVAMMVSALKEMRITKQFRDIVLQNAVVNATFAAAIESDLPSADAFATIGGTENPGAGLSQYAKEYLADIAQYSGNAQNLQLDGVKIPHLYPGTKLSLMPAGKGGPLGENFEQSLLRYIAASLGVSYEQLSRDYSSTNYSSARAAMAETWKRMGVVKQNVADRFATHVYRLWLEEAINKGAIESMPQAAKTDGWLYEQQRLDALSACDWIGASKGQIDELKETQAAVLRMRNGLSTLEDESARLGKDWRRTLRQKKREQNMADDLGVDLHGDATAEGAVSGDARNNTGEDTDD